MIAEILWFVGAAAAIGWAGLNLTVRAEHLAHVTGLGQALLGAVLIGSITSLAGTVTSVTAAATGHPDLAVANAVGGIAAQTAILVIADMLYREANLEHAAADEVNLLQGVLLILLLSIPLVAMAGPDVGWLGVHPATPLLFITYVLGVRMVGRAQQQPMWYPRRTSVTSLEPEEARQSDGRATPKDWAQVVLLTVCVAVAGWVVARSGLAISQAAGLSETLVGTMLTALATSLPEFTIAIVAVRRGAVNLAVGNIIGGNTFDVLFLGLSDAAYRPGSIFHAISAFQSFWLGLCIAMTAVLLLGFLRRQRSGFGNVGFESLLVLAIYVGGVLLVFYRG